MPIALVALSMAASACGSSGASQDELNEARTEGAKETQQRLKLQHIERELHSLKKHGGAANPNSTTASGEPPPTSSGGSSSCGGTLSVGPNTTCGFAVNVEADYYAEIGSGSGTVYSYSPTTGRYYSMYCTAGSPHQCTGGHDASVYFP